MKDQLIKFADWLTRKDSPYAILYGESERFAAIDDEYTTEEVVDEYLMTRRDELLEAFKAGISYKEGGLHFDRWYELKCDHVPDAGDMMELEKTIEDLSGEIIRLKSELEQSETQISACKSLMLAWTDKIRQIEEMRFLKNITPKYINRNEVLKILKGEQS